MELTGVKERVAAFDARHGASVVTDGWILFEDGAVREQDPIGALMEPPPKPWDLTRRVLAYRKVVLDQAVQAFEDRKLFYIKVAKANLNQQHCGDAPADPATATAELKELQKAVRRAKRKYDTQLEAVEAAKPESLRAMEQSNLKNRKANEALLNEIYVIEV